MGHEVVSFNIKPVKTPNPYIAYGLGITFSPFQFRKVKPDLILADDLESCISAVLFRSLYKIPFVYHCLDDYSLIASYEGRKLRYGMLKYLEKMVPKCADVVIAVDSPKVEFLLENNIPQKKLRMIPNGVDPRLFRPDVANEHIREKLGLSTDKIVLFIGKMNKYYELDTIMRSIPLVLTQCPKTQYVFVGDGDNMNHLRKLRARLGIGDSVTFTGFRPYEEVPQIINLSDVCVFPLPDSSALALFEFMACAKPVILPMGGTKKMRISNEMIPEDCIVQVEDSPAGFAKGTIFLLNNGKKAQEIGERARHLVLTSYDWDVLAKKYEEVLQDTLVKCKS